MSLTGRMYGVREQVWGLRWPTTERYVRQLAAVSIWVLVFTHLFLASVASRIPLNPPTVSFVAIAIIAWTYKAKGPGTLARTPLDWLFAAWVVLAVASPIFAGAALHRLLNVEDLFEYYRLVLPSWLVYRAAFGLCIASPETASDTLFKAILVLLGFVAVLGLLQSGGPLQLWAVDFALRFSSSTEQIVAGVTSTEIRPTGLFGGPNIFAFMNMLCCGIILGFILAMKERVREVHAFVAVLALGLFDYATLIAQSRSALVVSGVMTVMFLAMLLKTGKVRVFFIAVVSMVLLVLTVITIKTDWEFNYLTSVFDTGLQQDESYLLRKEGADALFEIAPQIAPLGAGVDRYSLVLSRNYDAFSGANGLDNGVLQAFFGHGILGVVHILCFFGAAFWPLRKLRSNGSKSIERLRYSAFILIGLYVVFSVSAVRHGKLETNIFLMIVVGAVWAAYHLQEGRARLERAATAKVGGTGQLV